MAKKTSVILQKKIKELQKNWEEMLYDPKKAFDELFLKNMRDVLLDLEKINEQAAHLKTLKNVHLKIENLLLTPRKCLDKEISLKEAANSLEWQKMKESDLSHLLYEESKKGVLVDLDFLRLLKNLLEEFE